MDPDITPTEARGGLVITVFMVFTADALFAMPCAWWIFSRT
jgi:hypothetical protein